MAFVVTLRDFTPPMRTDGRPWTRARIEESADGSVSWVQIEEIIFSDPDPDPAQPKQRTFTTELATLERGWYRIIWADATGDTATSDPVQNMTLAKWAPTVRDVAARLRARTKDTNGNEIGTFNSSTRPNGDQAEREIYSAVENVTLLLPASPSAPVQNAARRLAETLAAMQIELGYFPEQVNSERSPYRWLFEQYKEDKKTLDNILHPTTVGGGSTTPPGTDPLLPSSNFPKDAGGMVGWGTGF